MTIREIQDSNDPTRALLKRVKLVAPTIGCWIGNYQLKDAQVSLGSTRLADDTTTKPQIKLMAQTSALRAYHKQFATVTSAMRDIKDFYSEEFPINGVRQIPLQAMPAFLYELVGRADENGTPLYDHNRFVPRTGSSEQSVAWRLHATANEFVRDWPGMREELAEVLPPGVWSYLRRRVPADTKMRSKFYLDVAVVELATGGDEVEASMESLNGTNMQHYGEYIRTSMQRQIDAAITQLVAGPRQALGTALKDLNELIMRDGRVTERSFNPVRDAMAKLRLFDFAADDQLIQQIATLERRIGTAVAAELDSSSASENGFLELTAGIIRAAESQQAIDADIARFGKQRRSIEI